MTGKRQLLCALFCLAFMSGCGTVGEYWADRGADFVDVFVFEAGLGIGLELHAQVTDYAGAAVGWSEHQAFVMHGRHIGTVLQDRGGLLLLGGKEIIGRQTAPFRNPALQPGPDTHGFCLLVPHALLMTDRWAPMPRWPRNLDVGIGGTLVVVSLHFGLSLGELADFVTGFFGLDLAEDDMLGLDDDVADLMASSSAP